MRPHFSFKSLFIFFLLVAGLQPSYAQIQDSIYVKDGERKNGVFCPLKVKYLNNVIVAGSVSPYLGNQTGDLRQEMIMLDSNLNIIWRYSDADTTSSYMSNKGFTHIILAKDNYVYARLVHILGDYLLKIDPINGTVIWKIKTTLVGNSHALAEIENKGIALLSDKGYQLFDRTDGHIQNNALFSFMPSSLGYSIRFLAQTDGDSIMYMACQETLYKISIRDSLPLLKWQRSFKDSLELDYFTRLFIKGNRLLLFGEVSLNFSYPAFVELNSITGNLTHITKLNTGNIDGVLLTDVLEKDSFFYVTYKHATYGSDQKPLAISKVKMDGTEIWSKNYTFKENGYGVPFSSTAEFAASCITMDNSGDLYIGGYAKQGNFLYFKLNGQTGDTIYKKIITEDTTRTGSGYGTVYSIDFLGSNPVCVGVLDKVGDSITMSGASMFVVKFNPTNGSVLKSVTVYPTFPIPSSILKMQKCSDGFVCLQKWGRKIRVQKMDLSLNVLWSEQLSINSMYDPPVEIYNMFVSETEIYVTGKKTQDTLIVFRLDITGVRTGTFLIPSNYDNRPFMLDVVSMSYNNALVFYSENIPKRLYAVKISGTLQSSRVSLGLATANSLMPNQYLRTQTIKDGQGVYFFNGIINLPYLVRINYAILDTVIIGQVPNQNGQFDVLRSDDHLYVLASECYKYDLVNKAKIWSSYFKPTELINHQRKWNTNIIVAGTENSSKGFVVYCLTEDSGAVKWSYSYSLNGSTGILNDIEIDSNTGAIVLTGTITNANNSEFVYLRINSNGQLVDEFKSKGYGKVLNSSNDLLYTNGVILMGGNLNRYPVPNGNEGFLYKMDPTHIMDIGALNLKVPAHQTKLVLQKSGTLVFKWSKVLSAKNYELKIGPVNPSLSSLVSFAPVNPTDTFLSFNYATIDSLLNGWLVQYGDSAFLKWTVTAYNSVNDSVTPAAFNLTLVRYPKPFPFTPVSPSTKSKVVLVSASSSSVRFNWTKSKNAITYRWYLRSATAPYSLISTGVASNSGKDTLATISSSALYTIYTNNKGSKDSLNLCWHIMAKNNQNDSISSDTFFLTLKALKSFNLTTPVNATKIVTESKNPNPVVFSWTRNNALSYTILISRPGGSLANPMFKRSTQDTICTLTVGELDSILASAGLSKGDSNNFNWTVHAHGTMDSLVATPVSILFKRDNDYFNLTSPADSAAFVVTPVDTVPILFSWEQQNGLYYTFRIFMLDGQLIKDSYLKKTTGLYHQVYPNELDSMLNAHGIALGDSAALTWTVYAHSLLDSLKAKTDFTIMAKRKLILGTENKSSSLHNILLYPNPFSQYIMIDGCDDFSSVYTIYNVQGGAIKTGTIGEHQQYIDTDQIPSGFYMLKIQTKSGVGVYKVYKN